jgi:hypothetical protein
MENSAAGSNALTSQASQGESVGNENLLKVANLKSARGSVNSKNSQNRQAFKTGFFAKATPKDAKKLSFDEQNNSVILPLEERKSIDPNDAELYKKEIDALSQGADEAVPVVVEPIHEHMIESES